MVFPVEQLPLSAAASRSNLLQSGFWGEFKAGIEQDARCYRISAGGIAVPLVVVLRKLPEDAVYAYIPHGPDIRLDESLQGPFLETLSESLKPFLPENCLFIRYDTPWRSPYTEDSFYDDTGAWKGPPEPHIREMRMNFGSSGWNIRKAPTDLQPPDTVIIDIGRRDVLAGMRQTTRNSIRRSRKKGLTVRHAPPGELPRWYDLYRETARRKGFAAQGYEYFSRFFEIAGNRETGAPDIHLLLGEADGALAGGIVLAIYGKRAYYLYAATSTERRDLMPAYGLQWNAIRIAQEAGCSEYDLYGIPPNRTNTSHPMHGLYTFKTGFGGRIVHRRGCWDYPLVQEKYARFSAIESAAGGYHS